jgi:hypothetical protein
VATAVTVAAARPGVPAVGFATDVPVGFATSVAPVFPAGVGVGFAVRPVGPRRACVEPVVVTPAIVLTGAFAGTAFDVTMVGAGFVAPVGVFVAGVPVGFVATVGAGRVVVVVIPVRVDVVGRVASTGAGADFMAPGMRAGFRVVVVVVVVVPVAVVGRGVVAGFAAVVAVVAFVVVDGFAVEVAGFTVPVGFATATAPNSRVEALTRVVLEPPAFVVRNDQPGVDPWAVANDCFAGLTAAGTGFAGVFARGLVVVVVVAGGTSDAFGPEEATGFAAVVRSIRSALVGGAVRAVLVEVVVAVVVAVVVVGAAGRVVAFDGVAFAAVVGPGLAVVVVRGAATVTP